MHTRAGTGRRLILEAGVTAAGRERTALSGRSTFHTNHIAAKHIESVTANCAPLQNKTTSRLSVLCQRLRKSCLRLNLNINVGTHSPLFCCSARREECNEICTLQNWRAECWFLQTEACWEVGHSCVNWHHRRELPSWNNQRDSVALYLKYGAKTKIQSYIVTEQIEEPLTKIRTCHISTFHNLNLHFCRRHSLSTLFRGTSFRSTYSSSFSPSACWINFYSYEIEGNIWGRSSCEKKKKKKRRLTEAGAGGCYRCGVMDACADWSLRSGLRGQVVTLAEWVVCVCSIYMFESVDIGCEHLCVLLTFTWL